MKKKQFVSAVFPTQTINLAGTEETVVVGGRDKFNLLPIAMENIWQIGAIGWGSQGPAQAQNLRDSLAGTGIIVKVGLQEGSKSWEKARAAGFTEETNTLGEMFKVISESDLTILLISDAAQVELYEEIFATMKPGSVLGLSHGFLLGYLQSIGKDFPENISVIGVCPKGMGHSVRRLYEQGKEVNGAGINCSFAVQQDLNGDATDIALAWAIAIGAPYIFQTTLEDEYKSDIFGERGILLGAVWGILEALYGYFVNNAIWSPKTAFRKSAETLTGSISNIISHDGIAGLYNMFSASDKGVFERAYVSIYPRAYEVLSEIYAEVASGREIQRVVDAGQLSMGVIGNTPMWDVGKTIRLQRTDDVKLQPDPLVAGIYVGTMMAQINLLIEKGHCLSEVCNESVIEAVDSLNPYMHFKGVAFMVDNCSTTARRGTRAWGPHFEEITYQALADFYSSQPSPDPNHEILKDFRAHHIHDALAVCATMRPPVDIAVRQTNDTVNN